MDVRGLKWSLWWELFKDWIFCLFSGISSIHAKVSTILVDEMCVTFQQNILEIQKYAFIQEPKTSSESLE